MLCCQQYQLIMSYKAVTSSKVVVEPLDTTSEEYHHCTSVIKNWFTSTWLKNLSRVIRITNILAPRLKDGSVWFLYFHLSPWDFFSHL